MILLIQFRTDQSGPHEIKCVFSNYGGGFQDIQILNAYAPHTSAADLLNQAKEADAALLGGCGETGFESNDPKDKEALKNLQEKMRPVVNELIKKDIPTLGLCFGHQLIAYIAGGEVGTPESDSETGVTELSLTEAAYVDKIFSTLPTTFHAVVGHKASVTKKPERATVLAKSPRHEFQAFRYGENVYTCQFHPELDASDLMERLQLYPEYMKNEIEYDRDTELEAKEITKRFFGRYI